MGSALLVVVLGGLGVAVEMRVKKGWNGIMEDDLDDWDCVLRSCRWRDVRESGWTGVLGEMGLRCDDGSGTCRFRRGEDREALSGIGDGRSVRLEKDMMLILGSLLGWEFGPYMVV